MTRILNSTWKHSTPRSTVPVLQQPNNGRPASSAPSLLRGLWARGSRAHQRLLRTTHGGAPRPPCPRSRPASAACPSACSSPVRAAPRGAPRPRAPSSAAPTRGASVSMSCLRWAPRCSHPAPPHLTRRQRRAPASHQRHSEPRRACPASRRSQGRRAGPSSCTSRTWQQLAARPCEQAALAAARSSLSTHLPGARGQRVLGGTRTRFSTP